MSEFKITDKKPSIFHGGGEFVYLTFKEHFFVLKVAEDPSYEGVNGTPIVSLTICPGDKWDGMNQVFNFDRGLDVTTIGFDLAIELVDAYCEKHDLQKIDDLDDVSPRSKFPQDINAEGCPLYVR
mgnify:CR=1 FL=1